MVRVGLGWLGGLGQGSFGVGLVGLGSGLVQGRYHVRDPCFARISLKPVEHENQVMLLVTKKTGLGSNLMTCYHDTKEFHLFDIKQFHCHRKFGYFRFINVTWICLAIER